MLWLAFHDLFQTLLGFDDADVIMYDFLIDVVLRGGVSKSAHLDDDTDPRRGRLGSGCRQALVQDEQSLMKLTVSLSRPKSTPPSDLTSFTSVV